MHLPACSVYYDLYPATFLEKYVGGYGEFLKSQGEEPVWCKRMNSVEDVLKEADVSP